MAKTGDDVRCSRAGAETAWWPTAGASGMGSSVALRAWLSSAAKVSEATPVGVTTVAMPSEGVGCGPEGEASAVEEPEAVPAAMTPLKAQCDASALAWALATS